MFIVKIDVHIYRANPQSFSPDVLNGSPFQFGGRFSKTLLLLDLVLSSLKLNP